MLGGLQRENKGCREALMNAKSCDNLGGRVWMCFAGLAGLACFGQLHQSLGWERLRGHQQKSVTEGRGHW